MSNRWKPIKLYCAVISGLWTLNAGGLLLAQEDTTSTVPPPNQISRVLALLSDFEKNKSIDQLQAAMESMERVPPPDVKGGRTTASLNDRRAHIALWLNVLTTMEKNQDPKFDYDEVIETNVVPPSSGGVQFPSGVDPSAIKDPAARAKYEAALKANREKAERYGFQLRLHRMHHHATVDLARALRSLYLTSGPDRKELEDTLSQSALSSQLKQRLKAYSLSGDESDLGEAR